MIHEQKSVALTVLREERGFTRLFSHVRVSEAFYAIRVKPSFEHFDQTFSESLPVDALRGD